MLQTHQTVLPILHCAVKLARIIKAGGWPLAICILYTVARAPDSTVTLFIDRFIDVYVIT